MTRRLERPGPLLALVFALGFALTVAIPFAVNAAIVDPRVHDLPATGASISYQPVDGSAGVAYRAPGGWFYRESEVGSDSQRFSAPGESASIEVRFVPARTTARATLEDARGQDAGGLDLQTVAAGPSASRGERLWAMLPDGGAVGVAQIDVSGWAVVVTASGTAPGGAWTIVPDLLASVTTTEAESHTTDTTDGAS
ncbi:hypothetical protein N1031_10275 [Herbiconiux moechotypicola]|uniref:DUF4245 domain-containing protein n=1 Tax=Herbiconiux moechotypicola TaxID=637393 RepID=A0ABN3DN42_9MICO|nr:hypothetical protein [Herbiconiux moechotypicola]MCS5730148.1 hypothetical protein [Herbiconiux moechotypicola]